MSESEQPLVEIDITTMWCRRHLQPFQYHWPAGVAVATLELFNKSAAMPAVIAHAKGDANNLTESLKRFSPLCCFVSDGDLLAVYTKAGVKS